MQFCPGEFDTRAYVLELAKKYKHEPNALREKIKELRGNNEKTSNSNSANTLF
jgi:hypothetical protein